jgi:ATP-dependent Clp protease ATP-binding subunit ClpB
VLDDGRLTDGKGRLVDFKNTVLIMTSNIGSMILLDGTDDDGHIDETAKEEVFALLNAHFKPEFLNRIDDTVLFAPLSIEVVKEIVLKLTDELAERLVEQEIELAISKEAQTWIAENAYDPTYGARPLKRYLTRSVETPLAKEIIAGKILPKSKVTITLEDGKLAFETIELTE